MSGGLVIRDAVLGDARAIAGMMEEFFDYLCALDGSTSTFEKAVGEMKLVRDGFGERPLFSAVIAEQDGAPVGYAIFNIAYWADSLQGTVFMSDLFVKEEARGSGVGKAIMERLAEIGRDAGCEQILWTVWRKNPAAHAFYQRLGSQELEDEYVMRLGI